MKKSVFIIFFLVVIHTQAQTGYVGLNFDYNSRSTRALGIHGEVCVNDDNLYLNWDFALGANLKNEFYGRTNVLLLCYKSGSYWSAAASSARPILGIIGGLVLPWVCPVGISYYFYTSHDEDIRLGWYLNPLGLEYWRSADRISAWSVHSGFKFLYNHKSDVNLYVKLGFMTTVNTLNYPGASRLNGVLFNFSLGTLISTW
ncbi:MAG TPA: hypothetical protein VK177_09600 [Flavobacteriales bacterium]|nr:hypothetical protein [Flavobacteriales bacterium]